MSFLESLLLFVGAAILQDDAACISGGLFVSQREASLWGVMLGCFVGTLLIDGFWVLMGKYPGGWLLRRLTLDRSHRFERCRLWVERRGAAAVVMTRFLPGTRTPTQVAIGMLSYSLWPLIPYFVVAALLHTVLLVGGVSLLGRSLPEQLLADGPWRWAVLLALGVTVFLGLRLLGYWFAPRETVPAIRDDRPATPTPLDGALPKGDHA